MGDAVKTIVLRNNDDRYEVHLANASDGTGENAAVKVDKSTLTAKDGGEPASLDIEYVKWSIQGFPRVLIYWDHDTDDLALALSGNGEIDFVDPAGRGGRADASGLCDPRSAGGAGDILLTVPAGATTGSYDITLVLRKAAS